jgi:hypothetical protein
MQLQTAVGSNDLAVIDAIVSFADVNNLPPIGLLAIALQESSTGLSDGVINLYAVGDFGKSYGAFQIYTEAHGGTINTWTGMAGLANSMVEMRNRWQQTFEQLGSWGAWLADVIAFQEVWAPQAQGSIAWSHEVAAVRVGQALLIYIEYLKV